MPRAANRVRADGSSSTSDPPDTTLAATLDVHGETTPVFAEPDGEPERERRRRLRALVREFLTLAFAQHATVGSDQPVYWDPMDPSLCLSPDVFVRRGVPHDEPGSSKVGERGVPEVAIEIMSAEARLDGNWKVMLQKYRALGVSELVRFDPAPRGGSLRVWQLSEGELVEQRPQSSVRSRCLPGFWVVVQEPGVGPTLRLSRDAAGEELYPSRAELSELRGVEGEAVHR